MKIAISKLGTEIVVPELPKASMDYVVIYGLTQSLNDVHSSIARKDFKTDAEFTEAVMKKVNARLADLVAGTPPEQGSRGDAFTTECRKIVVSMLRQTGMKAVDANAAAKVPQDGFITVLTRKGVKPNGIEKAFSANWPKVEAEARRIIEASQSTVELEV